LSSVAERFKDSFRPKKIPALDGIRAISCLFVIIGHFSYLYLPFFKFHFGDLLGSSIAFMFGNQYTGVTFFFVLSGFLITNILIQEEEKSGTISLRTFFLKRVFRIFPAYYFYFSVIMIWLLIYYPNSFSGLDVWSAVTYIYNYSSDKNPWHLGHFWSLAVEEQFYLIWPVAFLFTFRSLGIKLPWIIIIFSPVIRLATYMLFEQMRPRLGILTHTRFDSLMFGCLLAYYYRAGLFPKFNDTIVRFKLHMICAFHVLCFSRFLQMALKGKYVLLVGYSIDCLSMCILMIYVVQNRNALSRFLDAPILVHLGSLSYSLYLWHMPFAWSALGDEFLVLRIVAIYVCALTSYLLIEGPFMSLREKVLSK